MPRAETPESVETLANELLLFRFGGHVCEGDYFLNQEAVLPHHREQALENARRIIEQDRLALHAHWLEQLKEELLDDEVTQAVANVKRQRVGPVLRPGELPPAAARRQVREDLEAAFAALASIPIEDGGDGPR